MSTKNTPWSSWQEWDQVRLLLTQSNSGSDPSAAHLEGVEYVKAWRVRGKVPLSVDVTAALVEAKVMDLKAHLTTASQRSNLAPTQLMLRQMFSLTIVRLVNGIADAKQRGRVATSVASLAQRAGLPNMLVDIRHAATHGDLPSLAQLRLAADQALAWLQTAYWDTQAAYLFAQHERLTRAITSLHTSWQAAVSKGKATGADNDDYDDEDDDDTGQGTPKEPAYNSAEGKVARKTLLSEIKSLVPSSWSCALLHPLLVALSPALVASAATGNAVSGGVQKDANEAGQEGKKKRKRQDEGFVPVPVPKSVSSCVHQLLRMYPHLCTQLVLYCTQQLAVQAAEDASAQACATKTSASGAKAGSSKGPSSKAKLSQMKETLSGLQWWPEQLVSEVHTQHATALCIVVRQPTSATVHTGAIEVDDTSPSQVDVAATNTNTTPCTLPYELLLTWLHSMLPSSAKSTTSSHSGADGASDGALSKKARKQLQQNAVASGTPGSAAGSQASALQLALTLEQAVELLGAAMSGLSVAHVALSNKTADEHATCSSVSALRSLVQRLSALVKAMCKANDKQHKQVQQHGSGINHRTISMMLHLVKASDTTAIQNRSQLQQDYTLDEAARQQEDVMARLTSRGTAIQAATQHHGSSVTRPRWRKVASWQACAVGCLPSACNPSGTPCPRFCAMQIHDTLQDVDLELHATRKPVTRQNGDDLMHVDVTAAEIDAMREDRQLPWHVDHDTDHHAFQDVHVDDVGEAAAHEDAETAGVCLIGHECVGVDGLHALSTQVAFLV